jgi:hypothetical protein
MDKHLEEEAMDQKNMTMAEIAWCILTDWQHRAIPPSFAFLVLSDL